MYNQSSNLRIFSEQNIELNFKGGIRHTDLIIAEAKINKSTQNIKDKNNESIFPQDPIIYLQCKWYTINRQNIKSQIEGVSGGFYQCCYDDIGCKIIVEAIPMLEGFEYTGSPLSSEIGPIEEDPVTQRDANNLIQSQEATQVISRLESIQILSTQSLQQFLNLQPQSPMGSVSQIQQMMQPFSPSKLNNMTQQQNNALIEELENLDFPKDLLIKLDEDICELQIIDTNSMEIQKTIKVELSKNFPQMKFINKTNYSFELNLNEEILFRVRAKNNSQRDLIYCILKHYMASNILKRVPNTFVSDKPSSYNNLKQLEKECQQEREQQMLEEQQLEDELSNKKRSLSSQIISRKKNLQTPPVLLKRESSQKSNGKKCGISLEDIGEESEMLYKLKCNNELLFNELEKYKEENRILKEQTKGLREWQEENLRKNEQIQQELGTLKQKHENLLNEKQILLQDIQSYKMQAKSKDEQLELLMNQVNQAQQADHNQKLLNQIQQLMQNLQDTNEEKNKLEEENINLNKNIKLLKQERDQLQKLKTGETIPNQNDQIHLQNEKIDEENNQYNQLSNLNSVEQMQYNEIQTLKQKIQQQAQKIDKLRNEQIQILEVKSKEEEKQLFNQNAKTSKRSFFKSSSQKNVQHQQQEYHSIQLLVNNLTEALEEKQLALDTQQQISKQLAQKIVGYETKLQILETQNTIFSQNNKEGEQNKQQEKQVKQICETEEEEEEEKIQHTHDISNQNNSNDSQSIQNDNQQNQNQKQLDLDNLMKNKINLNIDDNSSVQNTINSNNKENESQNLEQEQYIKKLTYELEEEEDAI